MKLGFPVKQDYQFAKPLQVQSESAFNLKFKPSAPAKPLWKRMFNTCLFAGGIFFPVVALTLLGSALINLEANEPAAGMLPSLEIDLESPEQYPLNNPLSNPLSLAYTVDAMTLPLPVSSGEETTLTDAAIQDEVLTLLMAVPETNESVASLAEQSPASAALKKARQDAVNQVKEMVASRLRLVMPVKKFVITSRFGMRNGRPHQGIDFAGPIGTPIHASAAGKVVYSGWEAGYGKSILIEHANGVKTRYAHCSKLTVDQGDTVSKGDVIGHVGNTGYSTGPHLHYEVIANGVHKNPESYLFNKG